LDFGFAAAFSAAVARGLAAVFCAAVARGLAAILSAAVARGFAAVLAAAAVGFAVAAFFFGCAVAAFGSAVAVVVVVPEAAGVLSRRRPIRADRVLGRLPSTLWAGSAARPPFLPLAFFWLMGPLL